MLKKGRPARKPDVDRPRGRREQAIERRVRIARHAERRRQPVAGAGRDEAQRRARADQRGADFVDRAVAAPDDHEIGAGGHGRGGKLTRMTRALGDMDRSAEAAARERVADERGAASPAACRSSPAPDIGLITATTREIGGKRRAARAVFAVLNSHGRML